MQRWRGCRAAPQQLEGCLFAVLPSSTSGGQLEVGCGLGVGKRHGCPTDILVQNWIIGKPAAFDFTVTSSLNLTTLTEVGVTRGSAAMAAEVRMHGVNDLKCSELGWISIPLAVETYGCWGTEAQSTISCLASHLAIQVQCCKSKAITTIYKRLNITLIRANTRALLSRSGFFSLRVEFNFQVVYMYNCIAVL